MTHPFGAGPLQPAATPQPTHDYFGGASTGPKVRPGTTPGRIAFWLAVAALVISIIMFAVQQHTAITAPMSGGTMTSISTSLGIINAVRSVLVGLLALGAIIFGIVSLVKTKGLDMWGAIGLGAGAVIVIEGIAYTVISFVISTVVTQF